MAERHLIKKYANRKLYDTHTSRYVTLESISALVRDGVDIEVVDRESGADLTPLILSQIVMGEEKRGPAAAEQGGMQERGHALLGYVRRTLNVPASLVSTEVERRRGGLEDLVDAAIERALTRLSLPSRREVERLARRVEELSQKVDGTPAKAPRKRVTATAKPRTRTAATPR